MPNERIDQMLLALTKRFKQSEFVYVLGCGESYIKIGIARNVAQRVSQLQTGNPYKLDLLKVWPTDQAEQDEEWLHCQLQTYNVRGEWFKIPAALRKRLLASDKPRLE